MTKSPFVCHFIYFFCFLWIFFGFSVFVRIFVTAFDGISRHYMVHFITTFAPSMCQSRNCFQFDCFHWKVIFGIDAWKAIYLCVDSTDRIMASTSFWISFKWFFSRLNLFFICLKLFNRSIPFIINNSIFLEFAIKTS